MLREEMLELLKKGEKPIDLAIQKWTDISKVPSKANSGVRHQLDEGKSNCALCEKYEECELCPLFLQFGVYCDESNSVKDKKYKNDFYAQFRDTGKAEKMLDALQEVKKNIIKLDAKSEEIKKNWEKKEDKSSFKSKKGDSNSSIDKRKFDAYKNPAVNEANFIN